MIELAGVTENLFTNDAANRACYQAAVDAYKCAEKLFDAFDDEAKPKWKKSVGQENLWEFSSDSDGHFFCQSLHLPISPEKIFNDFQNIDTDSAWSPRLNSRKIVGYLGEQSEIVYRMQSSIISASSRDLVCAKVWREIGTNRYLIAARHVETDLMPPQPRTQRVQLNLFAIRISPIHMKTDQCVVDLLTDGDSKGWLATEEELKSRATRLKGSR